MLSSFFRKSVEKTLKLDDIQAVFFDLDGTLVDVDMQLFVAGYLRRLTNRMSCYVDPMRAADVLHQAVAAMFANDKKERTLEEILFGVLHDELSLSAQEYSTCLDLFCSKDLDELSSLVTGHPVSIRLIDACRERGWKVVLATNPIFPRKVVDERLSWGKLDAALFDHVTSYETAHFCKPSPAYYQEILDLLKLPAEGCLMVGNDVLHDLSASRVGMRTCLLTPWKINRSGGDFRADWYGNHEELLQLFGAGEKSAVIYGQSD